MSLNYKVKMYVDMMSICIYYDSFLINALLLRQFLFQAN